MVRNILLKLWCIITLLSTYHKIIYGEAMLEEDMCNEHSCYPATGNLLIGRKHQLSATSTCGLQKRERFCIVSNLDGNTSCYYCDSRKEWKPYPDSARLSHRIDNIVTANGLERTRNWWQSENGKQNVSIRLDLEAEFHFTHLIMTFKTFRPAAMFIERSADFGRTWSIYRYFAYDCATSFPGIKEERPKNHGDVICTSAYSAVSPSSGGELVYKVISPQIRTGNPYADEVANLLKITNLRINFTKLHTLGDDLLDYRPEIHEKYYYALYELVVRGSCSCYGHAQRCIPIEGGDQIGYDNPDMVHGRCECTHNTKGLNCEKCEDFYNDLPWRPAIGNQSNECKRCECNSHANSCHFDRAVYQESGFVSGGVCDNCQHNTQGKNCEQCKPFFYRDPNLPIYDPYVCRPCNCNKAGSLNNGICESEQDEERKLVAGKCYCKENVEGSGCDRCKNGFWNLNNDDPLGCRACTCHTLGTINNEGCDKVTGECTCKRLVTGENCDQCLPEHYGLSDNPEGCSPCDCDIGGSLDNQCDILTGQCKCRPHFTGRRCNITESSFFCAPIDFYTYEAENAQSIGVPSENEPRLPSKHETHQEWTGTGYTRVREGTTLDFTVDGIQKSMDYNVVIRYESEHDNIGWENVQVFINRPSKPDPYSPCANSNIENDMLLARLHPNGKYVELRPSVCLDANVVYNVKVVFGEKRTNYPNRGASLLVDSIVFVPPTEELDIFKGEGTNAYHREEYNRYQCRNYVLSLYPIDRIGEVCQRYICPVAATFIGEGLQCDCDPTGSVSGICKSQGGQCECKPNVIGRRCDQCAEGTYGFGPSGCTACDCDSTGALHNFCDKETGQCLCTAKGITGRQCNQCYPGFWKFPDCLTCECNEHASVCDQKTGACIECRELTDGHQCERCLPGYFGDPRLSVNIPCKPCRCPGGPGSGSQHADSCYVRSSLDYATQDIVCNCKHGYTGKHCDECDVSFWGNPRELGGTCEKCDCNGNIDQSVPGNCDSLTGECLKCLYNTEGAQCEHCKDGFYGDAKIRSCQACVCNKFGTNSTSGECDRVTGQCPCLPNVIGKACDQCEVNHYNLQSGEGCSFCDCDPSGVIMGHDGKPHLECNPVNGQCSCKQGRGGRTCSECEDYYWGDPVNGECVRCECNPYGSASMQCNRDDGTCVCKPGSGGPQCNECARGYTGVWPNCKTCGECFQNWDNILQQLSMEMEDLTTKANNIEDTGIVSVYDTEFNEMDEKLSEIKNQLAASNMSALDISVLDDKIVALRENILKAQSRHNFGADLVSQTANKVSMAKSQMKILKDDVDQLTVDAQELSDKATQLRETDILGAYNVTRESAEKSQKAIKSVEDSISKFSEAESKSHEAQLLLEKHKDDFEKQFEENTVALEGIEQEYHSLISVAPKINQQVCGKETAPCDALCGGPISLCGSCGGKSCPEGAVSLALQAQEFSDDAFKTLSLKQNDAESMLAEIRKLKQEFSTPMSEAENALSIANVAAKEITDIVDKINKFLNETKEFSNNANRTKPEQIQEVVKMIDEMEISQTPNEIEELANQIREQLSKINNIDEILAETRGNKSTAIDLKNKADAASKAAEEAKAITETIKKTVDATNEIQELAKKAVEDAITKLNEAKENYDDASKKAEEINELLEKITNEYDKLSKQWTDIQVQYLRSADLRKVANEKESNANDIIQWSAIAGEILKDNINAAKERLEERKSGSEEPQQKAEELRKRATDLLAKRLAQNNEIENLLKDIAVADVSLDDINNSIDLETVRIEEATNKIKNLEDYYATCDS
uniref:Laminin subunit beta-1 n=1 Tax=Strongyloides stercoralis TaxID=6248 RepID=A0A0K0EAE9_STRER